MEVPSEITNIETELDIDLLDELNIDTDEIEVNEFEFKL